jgi:uncharacterized phage protein (TIGR01671 family)
MREIKFRAWDKRKKEMIDLTQSEELYGIMARINHYNGKFYTTIWKFQDDKPWPDKRVTYDEDDIELMQYTGLKDKNGKEIYEGDILHYYWKSTLSSSQKPVDQIFEVIFDEGSFQQMEIYRENLQYRKDIAIWHDWADLEIIGNIYENPDLINQVN